MDTLHINSAHFQLRHMDAVTAFCALTVLRIERLAFVGDHMDDLAFSLIGRLAHLEELVLNVALAGITDGGFLAGLESLRCLRSLELFSVRQVSLHSAEPLCQVSHMRFWGTTMLAGTADKDSRAGLWTLHSAGCLRRFRVPAKLSAALELASLLGATAMRTGIKQPGRCMHSVQSVTADVPHCQCI